MRSLLDARKYRRAMRQQLSHGANLIPLTPSQKHLISKVKEGTESKLQKRSAASITLYQSHTDFDDD